MKPLHVLRSEPRVLTSLSLLDPAVNSVSGLIDLLQFTGHLDLVIEVGTYAGVAAECFLHFCDRLLCVDHWRSLSDVKRLWDARLGHDSRASYLRMDSVQAARLVADGSAALVYIDAGHDEASVRADIAAWRSKVIAGGWIAGHDFELEGVESAVQAAFGAPARTFSDCSWLVRL